MSLYMSCILKVPAYPPIMTKSHRNTARPKTKVQKKKKPSRLLLLLQQKGHTPDPNDKDITEKKLKSDTKVSSKATLPANENYPKVTFL